MKLSPVFTVGLALSFFGMYYQVDFLLNIGAGFILGHGVAEGIIIWRS